MHSGVSKLAFATDSILILGGNNNQVVGHTTKQHATLFKRTNLFKPNNGLSIKHIITSKSGVIFTIDSGQNVRFFDALHGNKMLKISFNDNN